MITTFRRHICTDFAALESAACAADVPAQALSGIKLSCLPALNIEGSDIGVVSEFAEKPAPLHIDHPMHGFNAEMVKILRAQVGANVM